MSKGYIYIFTNPSFPEYVKIGYATNVLQRLNELNRSSAVPFAFRVYATYEVDSKLSDKKLHSILDKLDPSLRSKEYINGKTRVREFYSMSPEDAYDILDAIAEINGFSARLKMWDATDEEKKDEEIANAVKEEHRQKASPINFSKCGIPIGAELVYVEDESVRPTVMDDRRIMYNGEPTSLSALAQKLKGFNHPVQGTLWFTYNGKVLNDLRNENL